MHSNIFNRISNLSIFLLIIIIFVFKLLIYILVKSDVFTITLGGGSDAEYYHSYAMGWVDLAVNIWPVFLRYLNSIGLYSREMVSYFLLFLNLILIPIIVCNLAGLKLKSNQKYYFYLFLICLFYPTLYFFTFDIYRDIFMVFLFLIGCLIVKKMLASRNIFSFSFLLCINVFIGYLLFNLRPYLGFSFVLSLFLFRIKFTKKRIIFLGTLYILVLFIASSMGLLAPLIEYRKGFEELGAGSTLGLDFTNPVLFIPNFILSILGQLFGLYITNPLAIALLIVETVPFFFMLSYVIKNIKLADKFIRFLIVFFVLYASVWLIGNDNLGTAVRLRFYNYIAVYICFFYILQAKRSLDNKII